MGGQPVLRSTRGPGFGFRIGPDGLLRGPYRRAFRFAGVGEELEHRDQPGHRRTDRRHRGDERRLGPVLTDQQVGDARAQHEEV